MEVVVQLVVEEVKKEQDLVIHLLLLTVEEIVLDQRGKHVAVIQRHAVVCNELFQIIFFPILTLVLRLVYQLVVSKGVVVRRNAFY